MLADSLITDMIKHPSFKDAMEELATHPLTTFGSPTVSQTAIAKLDTGEKQIKISIEMIDADDSFDD